MAKTHITRNPGESEADFQRRYKREYMRKYYAEKLSRPRKPREPKAPKAGRVGKKYNIIRRAGETHEEFALRYGVERQRIKRALAKGAPLEFSGEVLVKTPRKGFVGTQEEWESLLQQPGESKRDWKLRNQRFRDRLYVQRHPSAKREAHARHYRAYPEKERARAQRYKEENPERVKATQAAYYYANREKRIALAAAWRTNNPERARARSKAWYAKNPGLNAFYSSKWRKAVVQATPLWANLDVILEIYKACSRISAETGVLHHVDHHYPLQGRRVCGLHVPENLRIIPATDNVRKHNAHPEED